MANSTARFLLFADLHLDRAFAWLREKPEAARKLRNGLRDALANIANLARERKVDALLCAGDLYEQQLYSPDTSALIRKTFADLHPTPVLVAPGNHDWLALSSIYRTADWSPNVRIFAESNFEPEVMDDGLTIWGIAHLQPAESRNLLEGFQVDREGVNLALFHGSESRFGEHLKRSQTTHAPFHAADIRRAGFDHGFVGHYHLRVQGDDHTYPGNPHPLSFGEKGSGGAVLVEVSEDGVLDRQWIPVTETRFHDLSVDVTGVESGQSIRESVLEALSSHSGFARVTLEGEIPPEVDLGIADFKDLETPLDACVVRPGDLRIAYDFERISREPTVRGQFVLNVQNSDLDEETRQRVLITGLRALDGRTDLEVFLGAV